MINPTPIWPQLTPYFRQHPGRLLPPKIMDALAEMNRLQTQELQLKTTVNQLVARLREPTD